MKLMLGLVRQRKMWVLSTNFNKAKIKLCFSLYYNGDNSYLYVNKPEFYFGSALKSFVKDEQSEIFLNGTVYDFWFDHSSVEKEDIKNIHEYLMVKNNIR